MFQKETRVERKTYYNKQTLTCSGMFTFIYNLVTNNILIL